MSEASEKLNEAGKLKRAIIDHMVVTMVASVVSCFFFLVWHLYSNLEKRVTEHDRESSAALMVLKEAAISYKVRLDMLEREPVRRAETATLMHPAAPVLSTSTPPAAPQPVVQQQLKSIEALSTAREDLQKKIQFQRPQILKP